MSVPCVCHMFMGVFVFLRRACVEVIMAHLLHLKESMTAKIAGPSTEYGPTVRRNVGYCFLSERIPDVQLAEI